MGSPIGRGLTLLYNSLRRTRQILNRLFGFFVQAENAVADIIEQIDLGGVEPTTAEATTQTTFRDIL